VAALSISSHWHLWAQGPEPA